jgi:hypothetical protein
MKPQGLQPLLTPVQRSPAPQPEPPARPASGGQGGAASARLVGTVAVLVLVDVHRSARWWAWSRLVLGRWPLRGVRGLGFSKVLGSGAHGGFGVTPSATHGGLFLVFEDEPSAREFVAHSPVLEGYRAHARELCVAVLRASASKGSWSGAAMRPTATAAAAAAGPIAALTRASIRPRRARAFWRLSPATERALEASPGCLLAAGLGEAPFLRQATFSLWRDQTAMDAYARSGAHATAIREAYAGGFFSETMFVRFVPLEVRGTWKGVHHG